MGRIHDRALNWLRLRKKRKDWIAWARKVSKSEPALNAVTNHLIKEEVLNSPLANEICKGNKFAVKNWVKKLELDFVGVVVNKDQAEITAVIEQQKKLDPTLTLETPATKSKKLERDFHDFLFKKKESAWEGQGGRL